MGVGVDGDMGPGSGDGGVVVVTPPTASLPVTRAQQFSATQAVHWSVMESNGGSIDATGTYVAPDAPGTYHVVATSMTAPSVTGMATVTVTPMSLKLVAGRIGGPGNVDGIGAAARFGGGMGLAGNQYIADGNNNRIRSLGNSFNNYTVATIAGSGVAGSMDGTGTAAQFNGPTGLTSNGTSLFVADSGNGSIRQVVLSSGVVSTLASGFGTPNDIVYDMANTRLIVSDSAQRRIFAVSLPGGTVTPLAGSGTQGSSDNTVGLQATFVGPTRMSLNGTLLEVIDSGELRTVDLGAGNNAAVVTRLTVSGFPYVAVDGNNVATSQNVYQINNAAVPWTVTALAGGGTGLGGSDGSGNAASFVSITDMSYGLIADGSALRTLSGNTVTTIAGKNTTIGVVDGTGAAAAFQIMTQLASDGGDTIFVVGGSALRKVSLSTGMVTTTMLSTASLDAAAPVNISGAAYYKGTLYFVSANYSVVYGVDPATGDVSIVAGQLNAKGGGDGMGTAATFTQPTYMIGDGMGTIYISDAGNNTIRTLAAATTMVGTLAGSGMAGDTDAVGTAASFARPDHMALDGKGALYVADRDNLVVRKIDLATRMVSRFAGVYGMSGTSDGPALQATFPGPWGLACDGHSLFVSSLSPNSLTRVEAAIRRVDLTSGMVTHFVGAPPLYGFAPGQLPATLNAPSGGNAIPMLISPAGDLVVGETSAIAIVQP
jgi:sugar lactone lactonase YvrE